MNLRWRVALALAALAATATLASGLVGYSTTRTRLYQEVDRSLERATSSLGVFGPGRPGGPDTLPERGVGDVYVQMLDRDGAVIMSSSDETFDPGADVADVLGRRGEVRYETVDIDGGQIRVRTEGIRVGALQLARSLAETTAVLGDLRRRTVLLVVVVSAIAALVGWVFARSITAPLSRLTRAAIDVERSGRLDVAVPVPVKGGDEVGQLGAAFNGMLGALATSRADQRRLVEDAGHELRTPLTSVRTNLAVLRKHSDLDGDTRAKVIEDISSETEELVALVEEVVALASGETDDAPVTPLDLGEIARNVAVRAERRHGRPVTVVADHGQIVGRPVSIERAISNLVDNAVKFDRSGGPIEVHVAGGTLVVHDRGPGFEPGDETKVFDRFYRSDTARAQPGSGLGLSIVEQVAARHGGRAFAGARPGGGASVGFEVPARIDSRVPTTGTVAP